jgi:ubiquitin C-terminal hydrolase
MASVPPDPLVVTTAVPTKDYDAMYTTLKQDAHFKDEFERITYLIEAFLTVDGLYAEDLTYFLVYVNRVLKKNEFNPNDNFKELKEFIRFIMTKEKVTIPASGTGTGNSTGLVNLQSSCYMNSGLQFISHTNVFEALMKYVTGSACDKAKIQIFTETYDGVKSASLFTPTNMHQLLLDSRQFKAGEHSDATEALGFMLNELSKNLPFTKDDSYCMLDTACTAVNQVFNHTRQLDLTCQICNTKKNRKMSELMLDFPMADTYEEMLSKAIGGNADPEHCLTCGKSTPHNKIEKFTYLPPLFMVRLERNNGKTKDNREIDIPEALDLTPYVDPATNLQSNYRLVAIVDHVGSTRGGHYYAYYKDSDWHKANDSIVTQENPTFEKNRTAYLLLYQRSDTTQAYQLEVGETIECQDKEAHEAKLKKSIAESQAKDKELLESSKNKSTSMNLGAVITPDDMVPDKIYIIHYRSHIKTSTLGDQYVIVAQFLGVDEATRYHMVDMYNSYRIFTKDMFKEIQPYLVLPSTMDTQMFTDIRDMLSEIKQLIPAAKTLAAAGGSV